MFSFTIFLTFKKKLKTKIKGKKTYLDTRECFSPKLALSVRVWCFKSFEPDFSLWSLLIKTFVFFEDEDYCGGASNGDVTSFRQTRHGFEFGLWFDRFRTLVEIWRINWLSHTLLETCPAHKDKVEIKYMGSIGGKTPTEPKLYLFLYNT